MADVEVDKEKKEKLEWLVNNRNEIQKAILHLYLYMSDEGKFPKDAEDDKVNNLTPAHYLAGVVFSLWRAVFLSDRTREYKAVRQGGLTLLKNLFMNNAIGYQQDVDARQWAYGYYVNNASTRLLELSCNSKAYRKLLDKAGYKVTWNGFVEKPGANTRQHWDDCLGRLNVALQNLDEIVFDEGWSFLQES